MIFPPDHTPKKIPDFDYDLTFRVLKVTRNGAIRWKTYYWVYLTAALKGKYVGLEDSGNGIWKAYYRDVFLGSLMKDILEVKNHQQG